MLYVTTRNQKDAVTANHILQKSRDTDDGLYVPMHFPSFSERDQRKFSQMSVGQRIAELLNLFLQEKLTGWDIDFCIGRYPVRTEQFTHRIMIAELWHNPDWKYKRFENNLYELIKAEKNAKDGWLSVIIKMAILAGVLGNRDDLGTEPVDIAMVTGDFIAPISAWYLRKMGFPIGNIICCCNENNQFWEMICNGQLRTDGSRFTTNVPEADVTIPDDLERLIFDCGGVSEVEVFLNCCKAGKAYYLSDSMLQKLRQGLFVSVVSSSRVETTIPNVYKTHNYILSPEAALAYSGLLDYRAKTGITRTAVVLSEKSPVCAQMVVAKAMGISVTDLKRII